MTENEAIEIFREKYMDIEYHFAEHDCYMEEYDTEFQEAIETATKALKEIQQYRSIGTIDEIEQISRDLERQIEHSERLAEILKSTKDLLKKRENLLKQYYAIGTVEECREARERQRAKKPINIRLLETSGVHCGVCPVCKNPVYADLKNSNHRECCGHCGQAIDFSEV